ncbi:MAG: prolyl oligopeptidase family serine peptidase [Gemmatimonadota bacterium]
MFRRVPATLLFIVAASATSLPAQGGYRDAPAAIARMLDARPTPVLSLSPRRNFFVLAERKGQLAPITEVAAPHLKLAGSRIDPRTNGPANATGYIALTLQRARDRTQVTVRVPEGGRLSGADWAPDGAKFTFTQTSDQGISLFLGDTTGQVRRLTGPVLNLAHGAACDWLDGGARLLCATIPAGRGAPPVRPNTPTSAITQETEGKGVPAPTYEDLLKDPTDESMFEYYFATQYLVVELDGKMAPFGKAGLVTSVNASPDDQWFLVTTVHRPFSYLFPWSRFPARTELWRRDGTVAKVLEDRTRIESAPNVRGAVLPGPRGYRWRADAMATLLWTEALDGGDPRVAAPKRDRILALDAPFTGTAATLAETEWRAGGITWGRGNFALLSESNAKERKSRTWILDPSHPGSTPRLLWERSSDDRYNDPGTPLMMQTPDGRSLLQFSRDGKALWLTGAGASSEGDRPFLDKIDLATLKTTRLFRSQAPYYESVVAALDADAGTFLTRRESKAEPANYFQRDVILRRAPLALTDVKDPAPEFAGVTSQLITYTRADGVKLSGTLYLPPGYNASRDGRLPFLLWVYPAEFGSADAASQVSGSPYRFVRPSGASQLFLLTQGYGVLDNPTFPIVGVNGKEPNDTYVEQLEMSAKAAIDTLVAMGVGDRDRMAVGGHSYGAFTTANLLAHTRLFKAGIARSGAYNRSLTPFGFQNEQRTYWEAEDVYNRMAPFNYADKLKDPILFIHGTDDDNQGTFPIQSERMYAAVKGNGGTARLVMLPGERHGYAARESIGQTLAEMTGWLDKHLKGPKALVP